MATGDLVSLSEQQLVDCAGAWGNYGCDGGLQEAAYGYYQQSHAAMTEADYPYTSGTTSTESTCAYDSSKTTGVTVEMYSRVSKNTPSQMKYFLEQRPLAVSIEADQTSFQTYKSGVFDDASCGTILDHAVLAVGYGTDTDSGKEYWLVKNSWGTSWGDQGYIKIAIEPEKGICGIQVEPLAPITN